jgi:hypothetical protein
MPHIVAPFICQMTAKTMFKTSLPYPLDAAAEHTFIPLIKAEHTHHQATELIIFGRNRPPTKKALHSTSRTHSSACSSRRLLRHHA